MGEQRQVVPLIPQAQNVLLKVIDVKVLKETKEGEERNWKSLIVKYRAPDSTATSEDIQDFWEGTTDDIPSNTGRIVSKFATYYANPDHYDSSADWYRKGFFLGDLKSMLRAFKIALPLIKGGLSDESANQLAEEIIGKEVMGNITQKPSTSKDSESGKYLPNGELENDIVGLKPLPDSSLV